MRTGVHVALVLFILYGPQTVLNSIPSIVYSLLFVNDGILSIHYSPSHPLSPRFCGEIPLCPYDSCRLLALNLYSYVEERPVAMKKGGHLPLERRLAVTNEETCMFCINRTGWHRILCR